jgi:hypothetical protein
MSLGLAHPSHAGSPLPDPTVTTFPGMTRVQVCPNPGLTPCQATGP